MRISNPFAKLSVKLQRIKTGKKCKFFGMPVIVKNKTASITLGDRVTVISGFLSNLVGLYQRSVIVARGKAKIEIGDRVGMSGVTVYAFDSIKIGSHTIIGANTKIIDSDMHPIDPEIRLNSPNNREHTKHRPIEIGENVFIGCNALILKGAKIGNNCVVGAGSVVTGTFEDNCIIAGNPAKVVKKLS